MKSDFDVVRTTLLPSTQARSAFDYLVAYALAAGFVLVPRTSEVRSIELQLPDRRRNPFSIQAHPKHVNFYLRPPVLAEHPALFDAAVAAFGPVKANGRGEYRTHVRTVEEAQAILDYLREQGAWPNLRHSRRFVASTFSVVSGAHLLAAARHLAAGGSAFPFSDSTRFDLVFDGLRLPPKAVFGHAASEALGFPVLPENFSGGEDTLSFRVLRTHGYPLLEKGAPQTTDSALVSDEDRVWSEGYTQLVSHLRRERGTGLAAAKRDAFRAEHGRLSCERCRMDPIAVFGSEIGEACIEVHHRETHGVEMLDEHLTRLSDLQCLCANCHRVTHRELKAALLEPVSSAWGQA